MYSKLHDRQNMFIEPLFVYDFTFICLISMFEFEYHHYLCCVLDDIHKQITIKLYLKTVAH